MYILRTVKGDQEHTLPPCIHFAKKTLDRAHSLGLSPRGGIEVEATFPGNVNVDDIPFPLERTRRGAVRTLIHLPTDADKVYVMNKDMHTVDSITYPPREAVMVG